MNSDFSALLTNLAGHVFSGFKILIPVLCIAYMIARNGEWKDLIIISLNNSLLIVSVIYFIAIIIDTAPFFNNEKWKFTLSILSGKHWYQILLPVFGYAILPQFLWYKKARQSVYSPLLLLLSWVSIFLIINYAIQLESPGLFKKSVITVGTFDVGISALFTLMIAMLIFLFGKKTYSRA